MVAKEHRIPAEAPPGYTVVEENGRHYPVRLRGGLHSQVVGRKGAMLAKTAELIGGQEVWPFWRDGERLSYDHAYPALYFLEDWVVVNGGRGVFARAWQEHTGSAGDPEATQKHEVLEPLGAALQLAGTIVRLLADSMTTPDEAKTALHGVNILLARTPVLDTLAGRSVYGTIRELADLIHLPELEKEQPE